MAREYFCAYHSYLKSMRNLSDAECGRLFRALLQYSAGDTSINLQGRESIAFDFISEQIDRDNAAYNAKCETNRKNGSLANGGGRNRTGANAPQDKDKDKDKEQDSIPPNPPAGGTGESPAQSPEPEPPLPGEPEQLGKPEPETKQGRRTKNRNPATSPELTPDEESALLAFSPALCCAVRDWFKYKAEIKKPYNTLTGRSRFLNRVISSAQQHGADKMADIIDQSMASGYDGVMWNKLARTAHSSPSLQPGNRFEQAAARVAAKLERGEKI